LALIQVASRRAVEVATPSERGDIDLRDLRGADGLAELDRRLVALCREQGPLRAVLARIAWPLFSERAWERLGFARLSDYAAERLGCSSRTVQGLAHVGRRFVSRAGLEAALVSGRLGWTKIRLLAGLPSGEDEARWIARAEQMTAAQLAKEVRPVDRGSVEAGAADEATGRSRLFEVRCSAEVRWKWHGARSAASRVVGRMVHIAEAAELIAAEVLSALPVDQVPDDVSPGEAADTGAPPAVPAAEERWGDEWPAPAVSAASAPGDAELRSLLDGVWEADAFGLDERFRRALARERRHEARVGSLLVLVWERGVHRALGYATRDAYARERLGMDPTRARALVRLERAAAECPAFARAYRAGALSWVKADVLLPLLSADPLGRFAPGWIAWARQVTVRRLREDVERALAVAETDPVVFRRDGGLPPEAAPDRLGSGRGIGAPDRVSPAGTSPAESAGGKGRDPAHRGIGAPDRERGGETLGPTGDRAHDETSTVCFIGPADVVQLFRAVLCSVRRQLERETGRLPTPGEALGAMLDHALASWEAQGGKVPARHRVLARDGWRCAVPGCSSLRNLHDHHIRFRSAGGSDAPENRVALCAFHHLRGVHSGLLRCIGRAPDGLTWQLGIRPGVTPLLVYRSGDRRVAPPA
jgi:hypothetical protein